MNALRLQVQHTEVSLEKDQEWPPKWLGEVVGTDRAQALTRAHRAACEQDEQEFQDLVDPDVHIQHWS